MDNLQPGDPGSVGGYRLLGRLGAGGMGQVFLGVSPGGRKVAVRQFPDRRVPFDASELVFCVTYMSVTLTDRPGGSADEEFGPGGPSSARQRQDRERATWREPLPWPRDWSAIATASDCAGISRTGKAPCRIWRKPPATIGQRRSERYCA